MGNKYLAFQMMERIGNRRSIRTSPAIASRNIGKVCDILTRVFSKYGEEGDALQRRIELYLLDCGVTKDEIVAFRCIMLDDNSRKNDTQ